MHVAVPLSQLTAGRRNPRKVKPEREAHRRLMASIRAYGLLEPLVVQPAPGKGEDDSGGYRVIAGKRRLLLHEKVNADGLTVRHDPNTTDLHADRTEGFTSESHAAFRGRLAELDPFAGDHRVEPAGAYRRLMELPDAQLNGLGRRFFISPEQSLEPEAIDQFLIRFAKSADRSLILTPSDREAEKVKETLKDSGLTFFGVEELEASKQTFVTSTNSTAVLANRYDEVPSFARNLTPPGMIFSK